MIIFDTETTGLIGNQSLPLAQQPEIIELAMLSLTDDTMEENGRISFFIKPRILPLPPKITDITGITGDMLTDAKSFAAMLPTIQDFLLGEPMIIAHNCAFDIGMLTLELRRLERLTKFPWPPKQICTVEENMDIKGRRMKMTELWEHAFGTPLAQTHRAMDDVVALAEICRWMRGTGKL